MVSAPDSLSEGDRCPATDLTVVRGAAAIAVEEAGIDEMMMKINRNWCAHTANGRNTPKNLVLN